MFFWSTDIGDKIIQQSAPKWTNSRVNPRFLGGWTFVVRFALAPRLRSGFVADPPGAGHRPRDYGTRPDQATARLHGKLPPRLARGLAGLGALGPAGRSRGPKFKGSRVKSLGFDSGGVRGATRRTLDLYFSCDYFTRPFEPHRPSSTSSATIRRPDSYPYPCSRHTHCSHHCACSCSPPPLPSRPRPARTRSARPALTPRPSGPLFFSGSNGTVSDNQISRAARHLPFFL